MPESKSLPIPPAGWELMRQAAKVQGDDVETWARISLALSCAKHLGLKPGDILHAFGEEMLEEEPER